MKILIALLLIFLSGCASVHFLSGNEIPVTLDKNPKHTKKIRIEGMSKFYFGGIYPKKHDVFIDKEVKDAGYNEISSVVIHEERSFSNSILKFITLGIYIPTEHTIEGYTVE